MGVGSDRSGVLCQHPSGCMGERDPPHVTAPPPPPGLDQWAPCSGPSCWRRCSHACRRITQRDVQRCGAAVRERAGGGGNGRGEGAGGGQHSKEGVSPKCVETSGPGFRAASFGMIICLCNDKRAACCLFVYLFF